MQEIYEDLSGTISPTLSLCCDTGAEKGLRMRRAPLYLPKWCPNGASTTNDY